MTISNKRGLETIDELMAKLNSDIDNLIEEMYCTFSKYTICKVKGVCRGCCLSEKSITELENKPVRELGWYTIYDYQHSAKYDETDLVTEAKFLLPRIFELFNYPEAKDSEQPPDTRLDNCHFEKTDQWLDNEIDLAKRFAKLHFKKVIVEQNLNHPLDDLIIMWYEAGFGLEFINELLSEWQKSSRYPKAMKDFSYMVRFDFKDLNYRPCSIPEKLANLFTDWILTQDILKTFIDEIEQRLENSEVLDNWDAKAFSAVLQLELLLS